MGAAPAGSLIPANKVSIAPVGATNGPPGAVIPVQSRPVWATQVGCKTSRNNAIHAPYGGDQQVGS